MVNISAKTMLWYRSY